MQAHLRADTTPSITFWRLALIAGYVFGGLIFLTLLAYVFVRYPDIALTPNEDGVTASIPHWFGATGSSIAYWLLGLLLACLYVYAGVRATADQNAWHEGVVLGAALGGSWIVLGMLGFFVHVPASSLFAAALLVAPVATGVAVTIRTGRVGRGALAGFLCGLTAALPIVLFTLTSDVTFTAHFLQTSWPLDHYCNFHTGDALAACEISDDLGFASTTLVALPLLTGGLGLLGGAIGATSVRPQRITVSSARIGSRAALFVALTLATIFVAELILRLW
jgi:hypothetical protein